MMNTTSSVLQDALKTHVDFVATHSEQFRRWSFLWQLLAEGKPVALEHLASMLHCPLDEVQAELPSLDVRLNQEGQIVASGLSLLPTRHQFHLGEQALSTWCALDALAFPAILGRNARVISTCPVTGKEIRLIVTPETIADLSPAGAVVSVRLPGEDTDICHVQEDICDDGNFFVSREVAASWPRLHPRAVLLSVEEAAVLGQEMARQILALEPEPGEHTLSGSAQTSRGACCDYSI